MRDKPVVAGVLGALVIAFSAVLVDLANVEPVTAALWRNAYALPFLGRPGLARAHPRTWRQRRLAIDRRRGVRDQPDAWHEAIDDVGAGLATVLGNLQVVIVPFVALLLFGERVPKAILYALPAVCAGVLLVAARWSTGRTGPTRHAARCRDRAAGFSYATFILIAAPRADGPLPPRRPAVRHVGVRVDRRWILALILGADDVVPTWPSAGWLLVLALTSQVLGWMLITVSLPRLPAAMTSLILTIQPIGSVAPRCTAALAGPSLLQLGGCVPDSARCWSPSALGREPTGMPGAVCASRKELAVVQAVRAALPELDACAAPGESRPSEGAGDPSG